MTMTTTHREAIANLIRKHYLTTSDDSTARAAEVALSHYDDMLHALRMLIGGGGIEGDLFAPRAHAAARAVIAEAEGHTASAVK